MKLKHCRILTSRNDVKEMRRYSQVMKRNGFLLSLSANILAIFSDPEECVQFPASGKWNCIMLSISHKLSLSLWACHFPSTDLSSEQILILFPNKYVMSCLANWIESRRLFRTAPRYLFRKLNNLITSPQLIFHEAALEENVFMEICNEMELLD